MLKHGLRCVPCKQHHLSSSWNLWRLQPELSIISLKASCTLWTFDMMLSLEGLHLELCNFIKMSLIKWRNQISLYCMTFYRIPLPSALSSALFDLSSMYLWRWITMSFQLAINLVADHNLWSTHLVRLSFSGL